LSHLGVEVSGYFLQRMKTKWGSCNDKAGNIRLNTELVKKPKDVLEYVIVHEMAHLIEPTHSDRFVAILEKNYPSWREARAELNQLPLEAQTWWGFSPHQKVRRMGPSPHATAPGRDSRWEARDNPALHLIRWAGKPGERGRSGMPLFC